MSDQPTKTYKPLINRKNDFKLVPSSRGAEKQIHALQVRFAGVSLEERRGLCQVEAWDPATTIPELTEEVRVGIGALGSLLERTADDDALLRSELAKLIESFKKDVEPVAHISADDYWRALAGLLLNGFEEFCGEHQVSAGDLNFKEIQEAYQAFFS